MEIVEIVEEKGKTYKAMHLVTQDYLHHGYPILNRSYNIPHRLIHIRLLGGEGS